MRKKQKLPAEVEAILRFISENQRLAGFKGTITEKTVRHAMKLYREGKLKRRKPALKLKFPHQQAS